LFPFGYFKGGNNKDALLRTVRTVTWKTRGEDIFQSFYASLLEVNVIIHTLVSGTLAMASENVRLIGFVKIFLIPRRFLTIVSYINKLVQMWLIFDIK